MNASTRHRSERGLTLVEILIVAVILGILATVTVLTVRGTTDTVEESVCGIEHRTVVMAVDSYLVEKQHADINPTGSGNNRYEQILSDLGYVDGQSDIYDMAADGMIRAQIGSGC